MISTIERFLKIRIERARLPTEKDVAANRAVTLTEAIQTALANDTPRAYYQIITQLSDDYSLEQIAAAALRLYDESLQPRAGALSGQIAPPTRQQERDYDFDDDGSDGPRVKLFISKGSRAGIRVNDIVGAIANECGIPGREIGPVTVHGGFSFAEIPARYQRRVVEKLSNTTMRGVPVSINVARPHDES
jgi:ATP-dependent RNA helicase DeaD